MRISDWSSDVCSSDLMAEVARSAGVSIEKVRHRALQLEEANPMLGHRGCRLAISYPEIPEMQARAIFEAALTAREENGGSVMLEIMVPLIATRRELEVLRSEEHTSELQSLMRISYAVFCLKKKKQQ